MHSYKMQIQSIGSKCTYAPLNFILTFDLISTAIKTMRASAFATSYVYSVNKQHFRCNDIRYGELVILHCEGCDK